MMCLALSYVYTEQVIGWLLGILKDFAVAGVSVIASPPRAIYLISLPR